MHWRLFSCCILYCLYFKILCNTSRPVIYCAYIHVWVHIYYVYVHCRWSNFKKMTDRHNDDRSQMCFWILHLCIMVTTFIVMTQKWMSGCMVCHFHPNVIEHLYSTLSGISLCYPIVIANKYITGRLQASWWNTCGKGFADLDDSYEGGTGRWLDQTRSVSHWSQRTSCWHWTATLPPCHRSLCSCPWTAYGLRMKKKLVTSSYYHCSCPFDNFHDNYEIIRSVV